MPPGACIEAVLQTGAIVTPYRRAGVGAPVLLLLSSALDDPRRAHLFERLAVRYRVIAPAFPSGVPFAGWLRDLIDGLGLVRPTIFADAAFAGPARAFARLEPARVRRVVGLRE